MDHCIAYRWPSASPQGGTAYLILWPSGRAHLGAAENPEAANAAIARRTREFGTGLFALFDRRPSDEPLPDGAVPTVDSLRAELRRMEVGCG